MNKTKFKLLITKFETEYLAERANCESSPTPPSLLTHSYLPLVHFLTNLLSWLIRLPTSATTHYVRLLVQLAQTQKFT